MNRRQPLFKSPIAKLTASFLRESASVLMAIFSTICSNIANGNWLSTELGLSVDIVKNPIGQRDDSYRGGEETEGRGRNQEMVSYTSHLAEVGRTVLSTEQFRSSALFCGGPVDLEFAARQSSWLRTESWYFQTSAEDIHFCKILIAKCIKRIRDLFE